MKVSRQYGRNGKNNEIERLIGIHSLTSGYHHHCLTENEAIRQHWYWQFHPSQMLYEIPDNYRTHILCPPPYAHKTINSKTNMVNMKAHMSIVKSDYPFGQLIVGVNQSLRYGRTYFIVKYKKIF